jgi:hypothetical protein
MPTSLQTTTVEKVANQCSLHTDLQNYFNVGALQNEPAATICNRTIQMLLTRRLAWKHNRVELCGADRAGSGQFLVTQYGVQDYRFAGASAFVLMGGSQAAQQAGGVGIDLKASPMNNGGTSQAAGIVVSGSTATVQTLDQHPFVVGSTVFLSGVVDSAWNSSFTSNRVALTSAWTGGSVIKTVPDAYHFTFTATSAQQAVGNSGAPGFGLNGLSAWGWMESCSMQDPNSQAFPQPVFPIKAVRELPPAWKAVGEVQRVAMMQDYANGVLRFRLGYPMSAQPFQINPVYQARAPILSAPTDVFPWPDNIAYVLYEVALFFGYRFAKGIQNKQTAEQWKVATAMIQEAMASQDVEEDDFGRIPELSLYR